MLKFLSGAGGFGSDIGTAGGGNGEGGFEGEVERSEAGEGGRSVEGGEVIIQRREHKKIGRRRSGKASPRVTASGLGRGDAGHVAGVY